MKVNEIRHRDAYQRDYDSSVSGMGKRQSQAYHDDGGANDESPELDPSEWYIVKDGKMFKVTVYPNQVQSAMEKGFSPSREEARARASNEGVDEDSGMLKVAKDDDKQTVLQNPSTGVQTQIDKTNPNAPRLTQDPTGKLQLTAPATGGGSGDGAPESKPNLVGKDVAVSQNNESVELVKMLTIAGLR